MTGQPADGPTIRVEIGDDGVATIFLNRPEQRNAFNDAMQAELHDAFSRLDADETVRCIVVTGTGRFFSSGADLAGGGSTFTVHGADPMELRRQLIGTRVRPWNLSTPIVAAMNGSAVGIGLTFPVQWDIRVMAEDAKYGFVFNRRGLMPEANSLWLLPKLIGLSRALELLMTGRIFRGSEAAEWGLAVKAVPAHEVLTVALEIARDIAQNTAPASVAVTKRLAYEFLSEPDRESAYNREWELFRWIGNQPDATEGVRSFVEKRPPAWSMGKNTEIPRVTASWQKYRQQ